MKYNELIELFYFSKNRIALTSASIREKTRGLSSFGVHLKSLARSMKIQFFDDKSFFMIHYVLSYCSFYVFQTIIYFYQRYNINLFN